MHRRIALIAGLLFPLAVGSVAVAETTVTLEKLSRAVLKEHFESTGEMPSDGAHVERGGERFYIK